MKVQTLKDIPDSNVQAVAYQVFSDSIPLHWTYKDGVVDMSNMANNISSWFGGTEGEVRLMELTLSINKFLRKSSYQDAKIVGGYSTHDCKYHVWYVTSHSIVLPWVEYYSQLSVASPHIATPPVFMGPYSWLKKFDLECLDTDLGNMLVVHNMERSSSFIYMGKIL
jgi:hypothetical protein